MRASKPSESEALTFRPATRADALSSAVEAVTEGKLGKALSSSERIAADENQSAADREAATALAGEIRAHVELVTAQAEALLEKREVPTAVDVFTALSKALAGTELGVAAKERLTAIHKDKELAREIDAFKAFEKVRKSASRVSTSKQAKKYEDFAEKYAGTRAAEKAEALARRHS